MKDFLDEDFLLTTDTAKTLFHDCAKELPIIDFHNHLSVPEMVEDKCYDNLSQVWLSGDHYKWRAMRADGFSEELITGNKAGTKEQFDAWAKTVQDAFGNPLYHWTHLELQRYFNVHTPLSPSTSTEIWNTCNALLKSKEYSIQNLLLKQNVEVLCTTDDPADDLSGHEYLKSHGYPIKVVPSFRPEKAINIEKEDYSKYIDRLSKVSGMELNTIDDVLCALKKRLSFFMEHGCKVSDHSLENDFYISTNREEVNAIYQNRLQGKSLSGEECAKYHGYLLEELGKEYARIGIVMQLHIGAMRNNSSRMFALKGADHGYDSLADFNYAEELSSLLDAMDCEDLLPKTILYYLNEKDCEMLAGIAGDFQGNESGIRGKVQLGAAWWFNDHYSGMRKQMETLASLGMLSTFVGMLTDSRSFLSFPRHEYFRRILCGMIGEKVENGEYPNDIEYLKKMVADICYYNAKEYFGF